MERLCLRLETLQLLSNHLSEGLALKIGKLGAHLRSQILEGRDGSHRLLFAEHFSPVFLCLNQSALSIQEELRLPGFEPLLKNSAQHSLGSRRLTGPWSTGDTATSHDGVRGWQALTCCWDRWRLWWDRCGTSKKGRGNKYLTHRAGPVCLTWMLRQRWNQAQHWHWEAASG